MKERTVQLLRVPGLAIVSIALMITLPLTAFAQTGGIGGRPANPDANNPRTQSIFIYTLATGAERKDQVLVTNNSGATRTISLYAVDGIVTNTGAFTCKQQSEALVDAGSWVTFEKKQVVLETGKEEKVGFTVNVPEGADVGEHSACVVFEDSEDEGEVKGGVRLHTRQAVRMSVTVPGDLRRNVEIVSFSVNPKDTIQQFSLQLKNEGNVSADVYSRVTLKNLFGGIEFEEGGQYPVMRDKELDLSFDNTKPPFWGGWYRAQADIAYDKEAGAFGVTSDEDKLTRKQSTSQVVFVAPSASATFIYTLALIVIVGGVIYSVSRRTAQRKRHTAWVNYKVVRSDTIQSIADAHHTDWKTLASTNKIKPPYVVAVGDEIRVPNRSKKAKKLKE